jgi:hypothetical protein
MYKVLTPALNHWIKCQLINEIKSNDLIRLIVIDFVDIVYTIVEFLSSKPPLNGCVWN